MPEAQYAQSNSKEHDHAHHVHDEWWSKGICQEPRLLRTGDFNEFTRYESEREGSWNELFFDLIFVAAFAKNGLTFRTQLGLQPDDATDWDRFMLYADFLLSFAVIERLWFEFTAYENKVGRSARCKIQHGERQRKRERERRERERRARERERASDGSTQLLPELTHPTFSSPALAVGKRRPLRQGCDHDLRLLCHVVRRAPFRRDGRCQRSSTVHLADRRDRVLDPGAFPHPLPHRPELSWRGESDTWCFASYGI